MSDIINYNKKEQKNVQPVAKGRLKKKSLGEKFAEVFISSDVSDVKSYVITNVIVPAIKNTIVDIVQNGTEMLFYGDTRASKIRRTGGYGSVSYVSYNKPTSRDNREIVTRSYRSKSDLQCVVLDSRKQAEDVLAEIYDLVKDYQVATVKDLYKLSQIDDGNSVWPLDNYGWVDIDELSKATISDIRDGVLLTMPKPIVLD